MVPTLDEIFAEWSVLPETVKERRSEYGVSIAWIALLARRTALLLRESAS